MHRVLLTPLVLSGLLACCTRGAGYVTPGPTSTSTIQDTLTKSASLTRRLADAADGYRDGRPRWVVIHREGVRGHHDVKGVFMSLDEANVEVQRAGSEYAVFGPFVTLDDPPDVSTGGPKDVVEVTVRQRDGKIIRIDPTEVDALFWTLAAFDKFIVPHLAKVDGAEYAAQQRELYRVGRSPLAHSALVSHKAGSF